MLTEKFRYKDRRTVLEIDWHVGWGKWTITEFDIDAGIGITLKERFNSFYEAIQFANSTYHLDLKEKCEPIIRP